MAMRQQRFRTACSSVIAVFVLGLAVSASAQGPSSIQASAATQAVPAGAVKQLTLDQAVQLALENNLGLQVQRLTPQVQDVNITLSKTVWAPTVGGSVTASKRNSPVNSFLAGADDKVINDSLSSEVSATQLLPWGGGNYRVSWDTNRQESNSVYSSPNPSLGANIRLNFTQPLLKDFKIDSARQQLIVSKANREISDFDLRQTVLSTVRSVKYAYWDLKAAQSALRVAQQSLDLARESLRNNRTRVEVGTMAPIDVVEAEAEVARREESVIVAEGTLARTADRLRTLIFPQDMTDYWSVKLEPVDQAVLERRPVDAEGAVKTALEKRTDLKAARKNIEVTDTNLAFYKNQSLPDLAAVLSYGQTGQGGTKKNFSGGFPPDILDEIKEGYGTVLSRMFQPDYNNWSVALQVSYPIGTSSAEANATRTRLTKSQQLLQLKELELSVVTSVRDIARQVDTNWKRLEATAATRRLMERRLESEQKKFTAGLSTNYLVFQAQRDLADAQYAELVASLDYNKSLIDFETVQESPTAGSAGVTIR
jgi:outer membrane protein TolC